MKTVLVPLAPGFEEIETITVVDILRRAGAQVTLAGTEEGPLKGSRGISVLPDDLLANVLQKEFDMVVLPGGQPGTDNLKKDARVAQLLKKMDNLNKNIAAICAAPPGPLPCPEPKWVNRRHAAGAADNLGFGQPWSKKPGTAFSTDC
jgi:4-methyl-5(b-hydroxyethyl)-thiazole monophosphate biosynthesis